MSVLKVEHYRQLNGDDILKVILKPTKAFPDGAYFYCDASDEKLVRNNTWHLRSQRHPYVEVSCWNYYSWQRLLFHQEMAHNKLGYYPDYINHIDGIEFDNVNMNLDVVTSQQNLWARLSRGYAIAGRSFRPQIVVNYHLIRAKCVKTEVEACQSTYQLELQYEDYRYDFLKDRRKDADILDLERTGQISKDEAIYRHVLRYADNAWYIYRYDLFNYFKDNHIPIPAYSLDDKGYMAHPITGQHLCPL